MLTVTLDECLKMADHLEGLQWLPTTNNADLDRICDILDAMYATMDSMVTNYNDLADMMAEQWT